LLVLKYRLSERGAF